MQAAIEKQAQLNVSLVRDTTAISDIIKNGSWPTILGGNLTFGPKHIAQNQLYTLQV
jgi:hypothetical protein